MSDTDLPASRELDAASGAHGDPDALGPASSTTSRLTDAQIQEITALLRAGRQLPPYLFPHLFETARDYELAYAGKARRIDVLAETMAVPLQPVKTFGTTNGPDWADMLVLGDNLQVLRRLIQLKEQGSLRNADGTDGVRLCYIDPPFASEREFVGSRNERAYTDRVAGAEFVEYLRRRLILIHELLAADGMLYVHLDTRKVHYVKVVLDEIFGEGSFRNEVIWKRTSAHSDAKQGARHLGRVHDSILIYSVSESFVWHPPHLAHDKKYIASHYPHTEKKSGRKYGLWDITGPGGAAKGNPRYEIFGITKYWRYSRENMMKKIAAGKVIQPSPGAIPREIRYLDESHGVPAGSIWTDINPINSQALEDSGYPTQKPIELMKRIIEMSTDEGDIVLDCFCGSGSTLIAADQLNRRWIGVDVGKFAVYVAQARLLRLAGKKPPEHPFTLYNAGLYDYKAVRDLPWGKYVEFVLQLFQCRPERTTIAGVTFDGQMGDHQVFVYNFRDHPDGTIGRAFVDDLVELCRGRLGSRCFIIAPALMVEPYEDYLDVEETRFFFLRIPYSIIAELHKRAFSELRQPRSQAEANALIDSVGFDFVQPPHVECEYWGSDKELCVRITDFQSEAFAAAAIETGIELLAMVMLDYSYDDGIFDLDSVHFAEDLAKRHWTFTIPREKVGSDILIVYVDIYGNEFRELIAVESFISEKVKSKGLSA